MVDNLMYAVKNKVIYFALGANVLSIVWPKDIVL